jgi:class 3 adenylate cyclase
MESSRQTTVLFADITGSTRLYETAGDSRAVEAIGVCMQKLREAVEAHGGRVVKTMGDAIMALFSTPNAAAAAAARMQTDVESLPAVGSRKLGLRIGFQSGPVIQRENDVFGDTVNLAYRLHEQAVKGQVLTSDDTVSLLAPIIRSATRRLYPVPVKGKAEEVELFELLWEQNPDITDVAQTVSLLRSPQARLRLVHRGQDIVRRRGSDSIMLGRDQTCQLVIADHKARDSIARSSGVRTGSCCGTTARTAPLSPSMASWKWYCSGRSSSCESTAGSRSASRARTRGRSSSISASSWLARSVAGDYSDS